MLLKSPILYLAVPAMQFIAMFALLSGCDSAEKAPNVAVEAQAPVGQSDETHQPLIHVVELDGFILQFNVTRTDFLSEAMAQQHKIDPDPEHAMLNLVILERGSDSESETVQAEVTAKYNNQIGQVETINMRSVETDGYVSYIGILDASSQRIFNLSIEMQPVGAEEPLHVDFEIQLDW